MMRAWAQCSQATEGGDPAGVRAAGASQGQGAAVGCGASANECLDQRGRHRRCALGFAHNPPRGRSAEQQPEGHLRTLW